MQSLSADCQTRLIVTVILLFAAPAACQSSTCAVGAINWPANSPYCWYSRNTPNVGGPGKNIFKSSNVKVKPPGHMVLKVLRERQQKQGTWHSCAEAELSLFLGLGDYVFVTATDPQKVHRNLVAAPFIYADDTREFDFEFSTWGVKQRNNSQYVVQPGSGGSSRPEDRMDIHRFRLEGVGLTHRLRWSGSGVGQVQFETFGPDGTLLASHTATNGNNFEPGNERVLLNYWVYKQASTIPTSTFAFSCFKFCPLGQEESCSSPLGKKPCCDSLCPKPENGLGKCAWDADVQESVCVAECDEGFVKDASNGCVVEGSGGTSGCPEGWEPAVGTLYDSWPMPGSKECIEFSGCRWAGMFSNVDPGPCKGPCNTVKGKTAQILDGGNNKELQRCCRWPEAVVAEWQMAATYQQDAALLDKQLEVMIEGRPERTVTVNVMDVCADADCDSCCKTNTGAGRWKLIDIEKHPAAQLLGFDAAAPGFDINDVSYPTAGNKRPGAPEDDVMPLCYRVV